VRFGLKLLVWATLGLVPASMAFAAAPSVSPIGDVTLNAGGTMTVNVVATDTDNDAITLTTSALPAFVTLNPPTTGNGSVVTTLTIAPTAGNVGSQSVSVTATAGSDTDTEDFQITVNAEGNQPPAVTAPALVTGTEGTPMSFTVTAADPDQDAITNLTASGGPAAAVFTPNGTFTSGTFNWTPTTSDAGEYDVTFTATNAGTGSATTHITVQDRPDQGLITIAPIADVTLAEGSTMTVNVNVSDPDSGTVNVSASLPAFGTLNAPTSETGTGSLATTITLSPGTGTAGTYMATVTATTDGEAVTDTFNVTVTAPAADFQTHASMIGNFNPHRKKICFRIRQSDASFDLRNVDLHGVDLHWNGTTLAGSAKLAFDCDDENDSLDVDHHGDGDDDECDECDGDHDAAADDDCDEVEGLHVCFEMSALRDFFGDADVASSLNHATIEGTLSNGDTFVATLGSFKTVPPNHGDNHKKSPLTLRVKPNPLNPKADISFTLTQPGRVKVAIYDLQGRLVRTVLDETRAVGAQSVAWNGMDATDHRVASGTYYVHIEAAQGREVRSVTVLK
jgi:hypothetical protein